MSHVKKAKNVLVVLWLAGSAGRKQLTGILDFVKNGQPWSIQLVTDPKAFTSEVIHKAEKDGIDGFIAHAGPDAAAALSKSSIPTVLIDFPPPALITRRENLAILLDSDEDIGKTGADFFLKLGNFASYGFIPDAENRGWSRLRERGFKTAMLSAGKNCYTLNETKVDLRDWLMSLPKPAAVMAAYDFKAKEALETCAQLKLNVPSQVAILGVDNDEIICEYSTPSLSSVKINHEEFGYESAKILAGMMASRRPCGCKRRFMSAGSVVERESTSPTTPATRLVQQAMQFIKTHFSDNIGVEDVVTHLGGVSRRLVDRRFREVTGCSIRRTIETLRLENVKRLLQTTDMPIEKISRLSGYANTQRLKYVFKNRVGKSMSEWRGVTDRYSPSATSRSAKLSPVSISCPRRASGNIGTSG